MRNALNCSSWSTRRLRSDRPILVELIKVLAPYPGGLRRWSVMRAIRKDRESAARDIPQKFEDEVERTFRRFCADVGAAKTRTCAAKDAFFYRPKEKAGEVWGIFPDRAKAWLDAKPVEVNWRYPMAAIFGQYEQIGFIGEKPNTTGKRAPGASPRRG